MSKVYATLIVAAGRKPGTTLAPEVIIRDPAFQLPAGEYELTLAQGSADNLLRDLVTAAPEPKREVVAYHDKDQPNGIACCPGYPEKLDDITPLYAGELTSKRLARERNAGVQEVPRG